MFQTVFSLSFSGHSFCCYCRRRHCFSFYLFIKRLCVCLFSFSYLLCARVCSTLILFCCSSCFLRLLLNTSSLIYSQLRRGQENVNSSILSLLFVCLCAHTYTVVVCVRACVVFLSVDYRWVSGCLFFIYLCVCCVCALINAIEKLTDTKAKEPSAGSKA